MEESTWKSDCTKEKITILSGLESIWGRVQIAIQDNTNN
jgi:hypothetical protein